MALHRRCVFPSSRWSCTRFSFLFDGWCCLHLFFCVAVHFALLSAGDIEYVVARVVVHLSICCGHGAKKKRHIAMLLLVHRFHRGERIVDRAPSVTKNAPGKAVRQPVIEADTLRPPLNFSFIPVCTSPQAGDPQSVQTWAFLVGSHVQQDTLTLTENW